MSRDRSDSLHHLALLAVEQQHLEDAVTLLRSALRESPENDAAWNDLGVVMEILGNPTQAGQCYALALRLNPLHEEAQKNLLQFGIQMDVRRKIKQQAAYAVASRIEAASEETRIARASSF